MIRRVLCIIWADLELVATERYLYDRHLADVPENMWPKMFLIAWIAEIMFFVGTCFTKISVLLFYRRLLNPLCHSRVLFQIIWANIVFTITYTVVFIILSFAACHPFAARWEHLAPGHQKPYHCMDTSIAAPISSAFSAVSDLFAVVFPLSFLLRIRVPLLEKLAIYSVFLVGIL
jgi:hypothetical protein